MIGQTFQFPRRVVVMVEASDGTQHAFEIEDGTMRWEWTGLASGTELGYGSAGRLTVEGRFHRKNRDPMWQAAFDQRMQELPPATKEITDGQA